MTFRLALFCLLFSTLGFAQKKDCQWDYTIENDSVNFKKTKEYLIFEKDLLKQTESVFVSLIQSEGIGYLQFQLLQKDPDFIAPTCVDDKSLLSIQLQNGKIINLRHANSEYCNSLSYDSVQQTNIRVLSTYFSFYPKDLALLEQSPVSIIQVRFATSKATYVVREELKSTIINETVYPSRYLMDNIHCIGGTANSF